MVAGTVLAVVVAVVTAREWMARERAGWDPHYGDPDGESIVQVFGFIVGAGVLLACALAMAGLELILWLLWRRRSRANRAAAEQQRLEAIRSAAVRPY